MKFLLDANFLVYCVKQKTDLIGELSRFGKPELYTLRPVVDELETISRGRGADGAAARVALGFARDRMAVLPAGREGRGGSGGRGRPEGRGMKADEALAGLSGEYVVCTNDRKLTAAVKKAGGKVVCARRKGILMML